MKGVLEGRYNRNDLVYVMCAMTPSTCTPPPPHRLDRSNRWGAVGDREHVAAW